MLYVNVMLNLLINYFMKKNKKWLELLFMEVFTFILVVCSAVGFWFAGTFEHEQWFLIMPVVYWLKLFFLLIAAFCVGLMFWFPRVFK